MSERIERGKLFAGRFEKTVSNDDSEIRRALEILVTEKRNFDESIIELDEEDRVYEFSPKFELSYPLKNTLKGFESIKTFLSGLLTKGGK